MKQAGPESEASGGGEEDTRSINEILEGEANTDSDNDEIKTIVKYVMTNTKLDQVCHLKPFYS